MEERDRVNFFLLFACRCEESRCMSIRRRIWILSRGIFSVYGCRGRVTGESHGYFLVFFDIVIFLSIDKRRTIL